MRNDAQFYLDLAKSISHGSYGLSYPEAVRSPGLPIFLWILVYLLKFPLVVVVGINMFLYLASVFLIERLVKHYDTKPLWFLALACIYPAAAAYSVPICTEAATIALVATTVYLLSRPGKLSVRALAWASLLASITVLFRPSTVGLPLIVCAVGYIRTRAAQPVLLSFIVVVIVLTPFAIRNLLMLTEFVVIVSTLPSRKQLTGYAASSRDTQSH
jgi:hypothetical protein